MKYPLIMALLALLACNNETDSVAKAAEIKSKEDSPVANNVNESKPVSNVDIKRAALAEVDMGDYIFRVHELTRFEPDEMQSKLMKWNEAEKDYYIVDGSIENKSGKEIDTGRDMLTAYFRLSDGTVFKNIFRGAGVLASYQAVHKKKYPQQQYDLIWKNKFPPGGTARAHVFGVEVAEGTTLNGIGFYLKNAAKHKFTAFK